MEMGDDAEEASIEEFVEGQRREAIAAVDAVKADLSDVLGQSRGGFMSSCGVQSISFKESLVLSPKLVPEASLGLSGHSLIGL
jgi:hypothetical protein